MSRGPIIDTGLSQALGFGSQQGIDIFRVMEQARQADLQRDILRDQMNRLETWRQTQAMVDRERIAQDNQELRFRQDEASRKRAADAADGAWYRRQLPQSGVGRMPIIGSPGAALPMQLPDPFAGAPTDAVKELWTLDARRQSEEMGRATQQAERAALAQRKIQAVRSAGGDDQDVYDKLKADNLDEFMPWEDTDFAAAKGRIADLFEASMRPMVQRGELNPSDYEPAAAALRRGDIDLDTAKSLVAMAKADKDGAAMSPQQQAEVQGALGRLLGPDATLTAASDIMTVRKAKIPIGVGEANVTGRAKPSPYVIKAHELDVKTAEERRDDLRKRLSDFGNVILPARRAEYDSLVKEYNQAKTEVDAKRKTLSGMYLGNETGSLRRPEPTNIDDSEIDALLQEFPNATDEQLEAELLRRRTARQE